MEKGMEGREGGREGGDRGRGRGMEGGREEGEGLEHISQREIRKIESAPHSKNRIASSAPPHAPEMAACLCTLMVLPFTNQVSQRQIGGGRHRSVSVAGPARTCRGRRCPWRARRGLAGGDGHGAGE